MRVLLDECLPARLGSLLRSHQVSTVAEAGWSGLTNGALLNRIGARFDVFVTIDQNMQAQSQLEGRSFGVIVVSAPANTLAVLIPLAPAIDGAAKDVQPGRVMIIRHAP